MSNFDGMKNSGKYLRKLIQENYSTQQEFADDFGMEIRSVNRYINEGIPKPRAVQELAEFFHVPMYMFYVPMDDER